MAQSVEDLFRSVMGRFATGITVITTEVDGEVFGMTANAFMAGSLTPPLCVISVARTARMYERLLSTRRFGVSFLSTAQLALSDHFARRRQMQAMPELAYINEMPVLAQAVAALAANVVATTDCGDHLLFIGQIIGMQAAEEQPLLYYRGQYSALHRAPRAERIEAPEFW